MPGSTPVYALPYQELADAPNGPQGQQDLAEAVEGELLRMDTQPVVQVFTASGTWNKPANAKFVRVRVVGGGGGGGGCVGETSGQGAGGGGGGGGYAEKLFAASALGAAETVTVGAGGIAGISTAPSGGTGGTSSFATVSATGGAGGFQGDVSTSTSAAAGGVGGTGTGGDINVAGDAGGAGRILSGASTVANFGGSSVLGASVRPTMAAAAGPAGLAYGGGAGGAYATTGSQSGGTGAAGVVIVETYF